MKSVPGLWAAVVFLAMLPMAAVYQASFSSGFDSFIHLVLAAGTLLVAWAVFDFVKVPKWINGLVCACMVAEAGIFLLQGVSHLVRNEALTRVAYELLGQHVEAALVDVFVLWCITVVLIESHGKTKILGAIVVSVVVCFELYRYGLAHLGRTPPEGLKILLLLLFVWLLFESRKPRLAISY